MWGGERSGVAERLREASHRAQPALYPPPQASSRVRELGEEPATGSATLGPPFAPFACEPLVQAWPLTWRGKKADGIHCFHCCLRPALGAGDLQCAWTRRWQSSHSFPRRANALCRRIGDLNTRE